MSDKTPHQKVLYLIRNFSHKYTLFLSTDGNFHLQRKNKHDDPDDVALNGGNAYFVDTGPYRDYLNHIGDCDADIVGVEES